MEWIKNVEKFFLKVENFFSKFDFIARFSVAAGIGMNAFNDKLLKRNEKQLKTYLDAREQTTDSEI